MATSLPRHGHEIYGLGNRCLKCGATWEEIVDNVAPLFCPRVCMELNPACDISIATISLALYHLPPASVYTIRCGKWAYLSVKEIMQSLTFNVFSPTVNLEQDLSLDPHGWYIRTDTLKRSDPSVNEVGSRGV